MHQMVFLKCILTLIKCIFAPHRASVTGNRWSNQLHFGCAQLRQTGHRKKHNRLARERKTDAFSLERSTFGISHRPTQTLRPIFNDQVRWWIKKHFTCELFSIGFILVFTAIRLHGAYPRTNFAIWATPVGFIRHIFCEICYRRELFKSRNLNWNRKIWVNWKKKSVNKSIFFRDILVLVWYDKL